jgi:Domain of unknown function (DUF4410)
MRFSTQVAIGMLAVVMTAGCSSTTVTRHSEYKGGKLPRPQHIWIYDFTAMGADVPADSAIAARQAEHPEAQGAEQVALGRELGNRIATYLVQEILDMGLPARRAISETQYKADDIVLRGYLLSIDEGSATKRLVIGFGAGASHLTTMVEGYQVTSEGLRKLESGSLESGGNSTPGAALGVAGLIAAANPAGLIISGGMKAYGEYSGSATIEGRAKETAKEIVARLKPKFREQGWIN